MKLLFHRLLAAVTTLNWATVRLFIDDPRKAVQYGRSIHRMYLEDLELPATRIERSRIEELFPSATQDTVVIESPVRCEGTISGTELIYLCLIAKAIKAQRVFEIGTFDGRTAVNLAATCAPPTRVYTLDLPDEVRPALNVDPREMRWIRHDKPTDLGDNVCLLKGDSATFDFAPYEKSIDMFFIDGSHSYEYVRNDTQKASACVADGGIIVWHDYGQWPGVTKYINEIATSRKLRWIEGTTLVVEKRSS